MGILNQGLILMVTGMSAVFVFLVLLVYVVKGFEIIAPKICGMLPDPEPTGSAVSSKKIVKRSDDAAIAVALGLALKRAGN